MRCDIREKLEYEWHEYTNIVMLLVLVKGVTYMGVHISCFSKQNLVDVGYVLLMLITSYM